MAISRLKGDTVEARLWIPVEEVESEALTQLKNIASLPWVAHVAVMPDVHFGKGATVGSVIGMRGAVSPAAVGVDIGCGMGAIRTSLTASDLPESLSALRSDIEASIPVGFNAHEDRPYGNGSVIDRKMKALFERYGDLDPRVKDLEGRARQAARHPGRREPLHRAVPGHGRPRVDGAPLRLPEHRQVARRDSHLEQREDSWSTTRRSRTATWPSSWPAPRRWRPTGATCTGRRSTRS
jgi:hypothetical protein